MNALVVFMEVPEETNFVVFHQCEVGLYNKLASWHGHFINGCAMDKAGNPIDEKEHEARQAEMTEFFYDTDGVFKWKKTDAPIYSGKFDGIFMMGFLL